MVSPHGALLANKIKIEGFAMVCMSNFLYMVVDLKVLVSSVYDDDPEHIKISFGESFFSSWRK